MKKSVYIIKNPVAKIKEECYKCGYFNPESKRHCKCFVCGSCPAAEPVK